MTDDFDLPDLPDVPEEQEGIVDHETLHEIVERAIDVLRPLGLTVIPDQIAWGGGMGGQPMQLLLPCIVRKTAKEKVTEDRQTKEQFNQMMAEKNRQHIEEQRKHVADLFDKQKGLTIESLLGEGKQPEDDNDCAHTNLHPEGFCLDCGHGLNNE